MHPLNPSPGNNTVGIRKAGHNSVPVYGCGKALCRNNGEAERLVRRMVVSLGSCWTCHKNCSVRGRRKPC